MNVIVLGESHHNTLGLIRSLGEAGHKVFLILKKKCFDFVDKSKYLTKTFYVDKLEEILPIIENISSDIESKPALFATTEEFAEYEDKYYDDLAKLCFCEGGGESNSLSGIRCKEAMNSLAEKCGLNVPKTFIVNSKDAIPDGIDYPVIVKSSYSVNGWKNAMTICRSQEELDDHILALDNSFFPLLVQRYIQKDYETMILGCSVKGGQDVVSPVGHRKIRFYPTEYSLGSYSQSFLTSSDIEVKVLTEKVTTFLRQITYTGLFSAEFVHCDGKYYFLEVNLRNDATSIISTRCNFNLPDILCKYYSSGEVITPDIDIYRERHYMNIVADIHHAVSGKINFFKWLGQLRNAGAYAYFDRKDIKPFVYYLTGIVKSKLRRKTS